MDTKDLKIQLEKEKKEFLRIGDGLDRLVMRLDSLDVMNEEERSTRKEGVVSLQKILRRLDKHKERLEKKLKEVINELKESIDEETPIEQNEENNNETKQNDEQQQNDKQNDEEEQQNGEEEQ
eukprot:TRINITY_DN4773_c0_g1_i1.p1 TRINITY_DN4773_c0_g1~~TRINITY_DN4773_c0_g1_i1.p1  ORF type:complete len:136 (+),score=58.54 TRINITY_DN4773_c0_g1_i1:41-409(+)